MTKRLRNKPAIGTVTCQTCGQQATVHQSSRGNYLYTRGCECKYDSRTGKTFQAFLWQHSTWYEGAKPARPVNVDDGTPADYNPAPVPPADPPTGKPKPGAPAAEPEGPAGGDDPPAGGQGMSKAGKVAAWLGSLAMVAAGLWAIIIRRTP